MPEQKQHHRKDKQPDTSDNQSPISVTLYSASKRVSHDLSVSSEMKVSTLLELALEKLGESDGHKLVDALKRFYQPILEMQKNDGNYQLPLHASLEEAGVRDGAVLKVAARPLSLTLLSSSDNIPHQFSVPPEMKVETFLELAMARLSVGGGAQRVEALKSYYQPVLELQEQNGGRELPSQASLAEEGVADGSVFRIAARPLKERIMFCRYG